MQKWEYHTAVSMSGLNDKKLNEYGAAGWELICVVGSSIAWNYYFKRRTG
jgi:hypothetical protein